ncbi:hypothetical protein A5699_04055 [Mycobacterium sp. E802]|uniref:SAM-dependent methyltransferase n=1 Tax=Mycobacterium sp. E802 TaxID=1834152 RepID=UPI0007FD3D70|nr:SAM-dependent methyltransferase [Mycobacterium sp. E802]OBG83441.1 hypothetical protein A5699_04055 [Mycobacterium sp. E802]
MARSEDDSWDIAGKVGSTALATAMVRAAETLRDDRLFTDPFAQHFIDSAVAKGWQNPYGTQDWHSADYDDPAVAQFRQASTNGAACRTRFIDDFLRDGSANQVVLLAAGLDARAWRLPWRTGVVVYELDQPGVLEFKSDTMQGERPSARRCPVPIDLRQDWPAALSAAGFEPDEPTDWVAEGLLPYLPPNSQDQLFERVHRLSAPGSRLVVDIYPPDFYNQENLRAMFARMNETTRAEVYSSDELFFTEGHRADIAEWLTERGWTTSGKVTAEVMAELGRRPPENLPVGTLSYQYLSAHRG